MPALYDNVTPLSTFKDVPPLIYTYSFEALNFRSCMLHYATNCLLQDVRTQLAWKHNLPLLDIEVQRVIYDVDRLLNNPTIDFDEIFIALQQQYALWNQHPDAINAICLRRIFESAFPGHDLSTASLASFHPYTVILEIATGTKHELGMVCGSYEEAFDKILQTLMERPLDCPGGCWCLDSIYQYYNGEGNLTRNFVKWAGDLLQSDMLSPEKCQQFNLPPPSTNVFAAFLTSQLDSIQPQGDIYDRSY